MAGIGEASAILSFVAVAAQASKAAIDAASRYKRATVQIEAFRREVGLVGNIFERLNSVFVKDTFGIDPKINALRTEITVECKDLFAQLETFREGLCWTPDAGPLNPNRRGRLKWVFKAQELEYLRARVDGMKLNILLMITLESSRSPR